MPFIFSELHRQGGDDRWWHILQMFTHRERSWHVYSFETLWQSRYHIHSDAGLAAQFALA